MLSLNRATIIGNLTRDPELRYTPNGSAVASFGVATNRSYIDQATGEKKDSVEFHDVVTWGKLAEICGQILSKGRKVYIEGRLQTRQWEGQDGVRRQKTEIVAENMLVLDRPKEGFTPNQVGAVNSGMNSSPAMDQDMMAAPSPIDDMVMGGGEVNLDDIPF
uniref:Single-stranded DNA-binding protein n=1 Tax=candidate division CPR3 bacterium TaxID=2268181 RepID=A0A7C4M2V5_UNCC3